MKLGELRERQSWSLEQKIDHSLGVIEQFYNTLNGRVYVSFSGGKDSTVLLWLARRIYPNIKACFCNTGNEYPDIVKFVRDKKTNGENIDIIYPEIKPQDIISRFGFPLISKETSHLLYDFRHKPYTVRAKKAMEEDTSKYNRVATKYRYLVTEPYDVSHLCCEYLKERPMHKYDLDNDLYPIVGTMACESKMRESAYLRMGQCNTFNNRDKRKQKSRPLSIWLEKDILDCIDRYNIPISEIYNKGMNRTGCAFCGFGVQFKEDTRLDFSFNEHPKLYQTFMNYENHGVKYRDAIRKVLEVNGKHLPDEKPADLFCAPTNIIE